MEAQGKLNRLNGRMSPRDLRFKLTCIYNTRKQDAYIHVAWIWEWHAGSGNKAAWESVINVGDKYPFGHGLSLDPVLAAVGVHVLVLVLVLVLDFAHVFHALAHFLDHVFA